MMSFVMMMTFLGCAADETAATEQFAAAWGVIVEAARGKEHAAE
jgi:hypothetical protein